MQFTLMKILSRRMWDISGAMQVTRLTYMRKRKEKDGKLKGFWNLANFVNDEKKTELFQLKCQKLQSPSKKNLAKKKVKSKLVNLWKPLRLRTHSWNDVLTGEAGAMFAFSKNQIPFNISTKKNPAFQ